MSDDLSHTPEKSTPNAVSEPSGTTSGSPENLTPSSDFEPSGNCPTCGAARPEGRQLLDVQIKDLVGTVDKAKQGLKANRSVLNDPRKRSRFKPGEAHPAAKYSDAMVRAVRALHREAGMKICQLMYAEQIGKTVVNKMCTARNYRRDAIPTEEDYKQARLLYQRHIKDAFEDQQQYLDYKLKEDARHEQRLKRMGIHPTQLPQNHYDQTPEWTAAGNGEPSNRVERYNKRMRRQSNELEKPAKKPIRYR